MKIAYDHDIFTRQNFGGISRYFVELAKNIVSFGGDGINVKLIAPFHINNHLADASKRISFNGLRLPASSHIGSCCHSLNEFLNPYIIKSYNPNLLHYTYYSMRPSPMHGTKNVITVYDMIHEKFFPDHPTVETKKLSVNNADHIICISENTRQDLVNMLQVNIEKTSVIHLGLSSLPASQLRPLSISKPFILYVGPRSHYKNFQRFLEAYASSRLLMGSFDVVAFGGGRFSVDELSSFERLKIPTDSCSQVDGDDSLLGLYYRRAALFVYPSLYEGFGIPPLEAMSCGCPVACSKEASMPEVVGDAAALFDPYAIDSIRECMESVLYNEGLRLALKTRGYKRVENFSWEKCARETLEVYRELVR